jgi:hypothetical protein
MTNGPRRFSRRRQLLTRLNAYLNLCRNHGRHEGAYDAQSAGLLWNVMEPASPSAAARQCVALLLAYLDNFESTTSYRVQRKDLCPD